MNSAVHTVFKGNGSNKGQALARYEEKEQLAVWITGRREPESWRTSTGKSDFYDLKAMITSIFLRIGFDPVKFLKYPFNNELFEEGLTYSFKDITLARFGLLSKKEIKRFDLKQDVLYAEFDWEKIMELISGNRVSYTELPKFPEVRRDLALVIDAAVTYEELEQAAYQAEKDILRQVSLFDIYQGEKIGPGKKSYAMSFLLRDDEKTLTDQTIERTMEKILRAFQDKFNASIR